MYVNQDIEGQDIQAQGIPGSATLAIAPPQILGDGSNRTPQPR